MLFLRVRALTLQPRIRRWGKELSATTAWLLRLLSLGGYARSVHVDGEARYVYVLERRFWFLVRSRVVPFKAIARVCYEFCGLPTSVDRFGHTHDTVEWFRVALDTLEQQLLRNPFDLALRSRYADLLQRLGEHRQSLEQWRLMDSKTNRAPSRMYAQRSAVRS